MAKASTGRRGRPATTPIDDTVTRLEKELHAAREKQREQVARRMALVGELVAAEMEASDGFRSAVLDVLRRRATSAQDKALLAPLLVGKVGGNAPAVETSKAAE